MGKIVIVRNDDGCVGQYISSRLAHLLQNKYVIINAWEGFPQDTETWVLSGNIKGVILSGSLASVNDSYAWIKEEMSFIGRLINQKIPILGICFGHQLIGKFFGVAVERNTLRSGLIELNLNKEDVLLKGIANLMMPVSHNEHVTELPKGFELLATSDYCKIQAMKKTDMDVYGIQFHPCYNENVEQIKELGITNLNYGEHEGAKVLHNFVTLVCNNKSLNYNFILSSDISQMFC